MILRPLRVELYPALPLALAMLVASKSSLEHAPDRQTCYRHRNVAQRVCDPWILIGQV